MKLKPIKQCVFLGLALAVASQLASTASFAGGEATQDTQAKPISGLFQPLRAGDLGTLPESDIIGATWKSDPNPTLKAFAKWVDRYLSTSESKRILLQDQGVRLAKARQEIIKKQIVADPRRALVNAVPIAVREQLPEPVLRYLEKRVDAFANWGTKCTMSATALKDEEVAEFAGQEYHAYRYGQSKGNGEGARHVEGGSLHGIAVGDKLAVLDSPLRALELGEDVEGRTLDFSKFGKFSQQNNNQNTGAVANEGGVQNKFKGGRADFSADNQPTGTGYTDLPAATVGNQGTRSGINSFGDNDSASVGTQTTARQLQAAVPTKGAVRLYQIGSGLYGKSANTAQAEWVGTVFRAKENCYENLKELLASDDSWIAFDTPQYLGDSGAPGSSGMVGRPPLSHTTGTKKLLLIRATSAQHTLNSSFLTQSNLPPYVADYNTRYAYMSHNQLALTFDYTNVYDMSAYDTNANMDVWYNQCTARAQSDGFNLASYDCIVMLHGPADTGYAGVTVGNKIYMNNTMQAWVFIHEFGHWLGLPHAQLWQSTDGNPMSASRTTIDYGDGSCWMSNDQSGYAYKNYNPFYLNKLRWNLDSDVQTVTRSGTYTVYQGDGNVSGRARSLKIARDDTYTYWLSILGRIDPSGVKHTQGVAIRAIDANSGGQSRLVDMTSNTWWNNAPLLLNQQWYDSAADLTLKVVEVGGTDPNVYAKVQVTFGPLHNAAYRPLVNGGIYRFSSRWNSGYSIKSADITGQNISLGLGTSSDTDTTEQWVANRNADGSYSFSLLGTTKYITVASNGYANGTDITQASSTGGYDQKFFVNQTSDGYLVFGHGAADGNSSFVVDLNTNPGYPDLGQWWYNGNSNQQWKPELIGLSTGRAYRLLPYSSQGEALSIPSGTSTNGTGTILLDWSGGSNQQWTYQSASGGYYSFKSAVGTNKMLDVDISHSKGEIWDATGGTNQQWTLNRAGGQYVRIVPRFDTTLSLAASGTTSSSTVGVQTNNGGSTQLWRFADTDG